MYQLTSLLSALKPKTALFRSPSLLPVCLCLLFCDAAALHGQTEQVQGGIDGIFGSPGAQYIQGWACAPNDPNPLMVQLATGVKGANQGATQLYASYPANQSPDDPGIAKKCRTAEGRRFVIDISGNLLSRAGEAIWIAAITQSDETQAIAGSGKFTIPQPATIGILGGVDASGHAHGWAFDRAHSSESISVAVFADEDPQMGAETGKLVWHGIADVPRPDVDKAYGVTGDHGFDVQLPPWVAQGVHRLSFYAVDAESRLDAPLKGSPTVPGASTVTSHVSFTTSATGFPTKWVGYNLPDGAANLVGLAGTVSLKNSAEIYSEILFYIASIPSGACPTAGTTNPNGPPGLAQVVWSDIVKAPASGVFTTPVNFTLPVGLPISNCLVIGVNGSTVAGPHPVTGTVDLVSTFTPGPAAPTQILGMDSEFCFGQNWGCQAATTDDSQSFAAVTQVTQRSTLNAIWGNISDSTFDGSDNFGPLPTGPWSATNEVWVYPQAECAQFPPDRSYNGPGEYTRQIPSGARPLVTAPLLGSGGVAAGETYNSLLPGPANGITVYKTFSGVTLNAGECLVVLFGVNHTTGAFDNEDQIRAIVTPF